MENISTNQPIGRGDSSTAEWAKHDVSETLERKGHAMKEQVSSKVDTLSSQMKDRANQAINSTSKQVDRVAMYLREKDSQEMMEDLQVIIRKHPGKSAVAGLLLGVLVGRTLR